MNNYTVTMESGNDYFLSAMSPEAAMAESERLARVVHGVNDTALEAV